MAMPAVLPPLTVDDLEAFPEDGNRYELLYGVLLVTPQAGFPHQIVAGRLTRQLAAFIEVETDLQFCAPGAVQVRPSVHLEPDILIGNWPQKPQWDAVEKHWLAVEVSGTGSRAYDRMYKRDAYLSLGVAEVWLVDLDERRIFVSRFGGTKDEPYDTTLTWRSPGGRELQIDIPGLFRGLSEMPG